MIRALAVATLAVGALGLPVSSPAGAACVDRAQADADLLLVRLPGQVPVQPLQASRAGADQQGPGEDAAAGSVNGTSVPLPGVRVDLRTGTADAEGAVTGAGAAASARSSVQQVMLDVAATPLTPAALVVVDGITSVAQADRAGSSAAVSASVSVNGTTVAVGGPVPPVVVPGVGVLHLFEQVTTSGPGGTSATATAVRLELTTGLSVAVARSTARSTGPTCT